MFEELKTAIIRWNATASERQKLQHSYIVIAILTILVGGIVSLANANLGHKLAVAALVAALVFICNGVIWSLVNSSVIARIPTRPKRK